MSSLLSCNMSQQGLSPQLTTDESWAFCKQAILENLPVIRENLHGHVQLRRHMPGVAVPRPFGHGELGRAYQRQRRLAPRPTLALHAEPRATAKITILRVHKLMA